uniref:TSA: Wollemia nobilis Ref_Wollemi_Transcript_15573_1900 transcribed RNA sequence n=1 Tax=Wollemia nobilis TaxID=56998 RepID=A0A0C9RS54_9CONI
MFDGQATYFVSHFPGSSHLEPQWQQNQIYFTAYLLGLKKLRMKLVEEDDGDSKEMMLRDSHQAKVLDILKIAEMKGHDSVPQTSFVSVEETTDCPGEQKEADMNGKGSDDSLLPGLQDDIAIQCLARISRSDYGSLGSLNSRFNSLVQSGYLYRLRRQLGIVEHWIYLACSLVGWEVFDPKQQRWMRLPRMPSDDCFNFADKESLAVGTELLVFGREITGFAVWRYSLLTHNWSRGLTMSFPRCLFGSSSNGEIAIVAGGCDRNVEALKSAELYNSELGRWETLPEMHFPRKLCSGFFMDGKFYVIGGLSSTMDSLTCGEEYNLQTRTWRRIPNMFPAGNRAAHAPPLVAVVNNELYAVEYIQNEVKKYNKAENLWHVVGRLPLRADAANGWGLAFKACGNDLIVIGGQRSQEGECIVLNSWQPTSDGRPPEWKVLDVKEHAGVFVYNCAVMGC